MGKGYVEVKGDIRTLEDLKNILNFSKSIKGEYFLYGEECYKHIQDFLDKNYMNELFLKAKTPEHLESFNKKYICIDGNCCLELKKDKELYIEEQLVYILLIYQYNQIWEKFTKGARLKIETFFRLNQEKYRELAIQMTRFGYPLKGVDCLKVNENSVIKLVDYRMVTLSTRLRILSRKFENILVLGFSDEDSSKISKALKTYSVGKVKVYIKSIEKIKQEQNQRKVAVGNGYKNKDMRINFNYMKDSCVMVQYKNVREICDELFISYKNVFLF